MPSISHENDESDEDKENTSLFNDRRRWVAAAILDRRNQQSLKLETFFYATMKAGKRDVSSRKRNVRDKMKLTSRMCNTKRKWKYGKLTHFTVFPFLYALGCCLSIYSISLSINEIIERDENLLVPSDRTSEHSMVLTTIESS